MVLMFWSSEQFRKKYKPTKLERSIADKKHSFWIRVIGQNFEFSKFWHKQNLLHFEWLWTTSRSSIRGLSFEKMTFIWWFYLQTLCLIYRLEMFQKKHHILPVRFSLGITHRRSPLESSFRLFHSRSEHYTGTDRRSPWSDWTPAD